jgi:CubicO group peptidase (beta-lactamase class C family)
MFPHRRFGGGALAVYLDGEPVVDVWTGWADRRGRLPWTADTAAMVFSATKGVASTVVHRLVDRGLIDYEAPVADYWPEFAAAGKDGVTVRMVLAHRAGLPAIRQLLPRFAMYDWAAMAAALAAETPWWEPGRTHGYHVNTFGFLVGEIVRRVSGMTVGAFFRREIAGPLDADFHFGIGRDDDARTADYTFEGEPPETAEDDDGDTRALLLRRVYLNPPGVSGLGTVNTRAWRAAEMPSTNGHATARALARIYAALACGGATGGVRCLQAATIDHATVEASAGTDAVLQRPSRFGLGFQLTQPERPLGTNARSFGHFGAGGALGFADPEARLAFGYTMNQAGPRWQNPRNRALIDAVYAAL